MGILSLDGCCCGCSLKVGSIIIAAFELFMNTALMGFGITSAVMTNSSAPVYDIMIVLVCLALMTVSIALLIGVIKDMHQLLLPWLILIIVNTCIIFMTVGLVPVFFRFMHPDLLILLMGSPFLAARIYSIMVIANLYNTLKATRITSIGMEENIAFVNNI